ncbi:chemotaxis-specific protein-glutamate methyltransferase CheB [Persicobacter diffluens]|uniref:Protein-glutamate methylesterase/protein-glutamine glutaminase n=1 Tax=Persicobacter diffluens TaxID=981 RepID=A0AAN4W2D1_9BACT|nr:chemotaxis response regulator protein-glutamate methylesterase [Persicobacter diffluens]
MVKPKINILIVDDSSIMRHLIAHVLEENEDFLVVGTANNGKEAISQNRQLRPDVVLMDMNMGDYDGPFAVDQIMQSPWPVPIIILSALGNSDMGPILGALESGAYDYVNKSPSHNSDIKAIKVPLFEKIYAAKETDIATLLGNKDQKRNTAPHTFDQFLAYEVILLGASTGGPSAVESFISRVPENLPLPVIITQHMPASFVPSFAARLNEMNNKEVVLASSGTSLEKGKIYLLPGGHNTVLRKIGSEIKFRRSRRKFKAFNDPSIDGLFESAVNIFGAKCIGVLMTGMGRDGAEGMLKVKNAGGLTIAQSKETCVVYGMPKAANLAGAVQYNIKLREIPSFVISAIS